MVLVPEVIKAIKPIRDVPVLAAGGIMTGRQAFQTTVVVLATLLLAYLLYRVGQILLVLFLAIIFASAIRPVVDTLSRWRIPRGLAILLVYLLVVGILFGLIVVATPPLVEMTTGLLSGELLREPLLRFSSWLTIFGWENFRVILPVIALPEQVQALIEQARGMAEQQVWPLAMGGVLVLAQLVLVFVMTFYWLTAREPMLAFILRLSPMRIRGQVENIWNCLLYTSDAADDLLCVDLGGRRLTKKKKHHTYHLHPQHTATLR